MGIRSGASPDVTSMKSPRSTYYDATTRVHANTRSAQPCSCLVVHHP